MARPRKFIEINGQIILGVSYHKPTKRHYIIRGGQRVYFEKWQEARAASLADLADQVSQTDLVKLEAETSVRWAAMREKLILDGRQEEADDLLFPAEDVLREGNPARIRHCENVRKQADSLGVPEFDIHQAKTAINTETGRNPRLSAVGEAWIKGKSTERGVEYIDAKTRKSLKKSPLSQHMRNVLANWKRFIVCAGDVRVADLEPEHFRKFHQWADKQASKRETNCWHVTLMREVKNVFNYARRTYSDWQWAPDIDQHVRAYTPKRYTPSEENAEPMPPRIFRALVDRCTELTSIDSKQFDISTQSGRAKRLQATRSERKGRMMRLIVKLAANCGLNATDFSLIRWSDLHLDHSCPHLDLPREKAKRTAGRGIDRRTPLIPEVVQELTEWRRLNPAAVEGSFVFVDSQGSPISNTTISRAVSAMLGEADLGMSFTFRHLRNVGPTLAEQGQLSGDMIARFLGHTPQATSRYYRGRVDVSHVKPVVDLIEAKYFRSTNPE